MQFATIDEVLGSQGRWKELCEHRLEIIQDLIEMRRKLEESNPDDIRAKGWAVAVHNDYRLDGKSHTFWLFTKDGIAIKGEGHTDAEALEQVRAEIKAKQPARIWDDVEKIFRHPDE